MSEERQTGAVQTKRPRITDRGRPKTELIMLAVLSLPKTDGKFVTKTDACGKQVGCVPPRKQDDGKVGPVGYWSRTLNDAENNYDTRHREPLTVMRDDLLLRLYVQEIRFIVRMDPQALKEVLELKQSSGRLACWRLRLTEFDFATQHQPGRNHLAVDALSRLPTDQQNRSDFDDYIPTYKANKVHVVKGNYDDTNAERITVQSFVSGHKKDTYWHQLAEEADASNSQCFRDKFGIFSRRA